VRAVTGTDSHTGIVVILTALNVEYDAVRAHLIGLQARAHPAGTRFEIGTLRGTWRRIALAITGTGSTSSAIIAERAISLFAPQALLFVGIAGALKDDIALGDVVVATRIYAYHGGRAEMNEFLVRPRGWETPHHLEQLARHVSRSQRWIAMLPANARARPPTVHFGPVAAGDVVLDDPNSAVADRIRRHYNDAAAIEMESAGVARSPDEADGCRTKTR
jgi:adenosylhomocysteine nucleosidase